MSGILTVTFQAGASGGWRIVRNQAVLGEGLPTADRLAMYGGFPNKDVAAAFELHGVVSHPRYATEQELARLRPLSAPLGRAEARCAALIPIGKSEDWWRLGQDRRRAVFEETSRHTARSLRYLPAVARQLHHCRDLGGPFDFLTWFEYAPEHADAFEELVAELRSTEEWRYVIREVDLRLEKLD